MSDPLKRSPLSFNFSCDPRIHFFFPINEHRVILYHGYFVSCSSSFFFILINFNYNNFHGIFSTFSFLSRLLFFLNSKLCFSIQYLDADSPVIVSSKLH